MNTLFQVCQIIFNLVEVDSRLCKKYLVPLIRTLGEHQYATISAALCPTGFLWTSDRSSTHRWSSRGAGRRVNLMLLGLQQLAAVRSVRLSHAKGTVHASRRSTHRYCIKTARSHHSNVAPASLQRWVQFKTELDMVPILMTQSNPIQSNLDVHNFDPFLSDP